MWWASIIMQGKIHHCVQRKPERAQTKYKNPTNLEWKEKRLYLNLCANQLITYIERKSRGWIECPNFVGRERNFWWDKNGLMAFFQWVLVSFGPFLFVYIETEFVERENELVREREREGTWNGLLGMMSNVFPQFVMTCESRINYFFLNKMVKFRFCLIKLEMDACVIFIYI